MLYLAFPIQFYGNQSFLPEIWGQLSVLFLLLNDGYIINIFVIIIIIIIIIIFKEYYETYLNTK